MLENDSIYETRVCSKALRKKYQEGYIPVVPDIKLFSPKEGNLMRERNPVEYALLMEEAGAPAISVVTEQEHYGGSLKLLEKIAEKTLVPVLRKDFIKTKQQIKDSKKAGADAVLLITSILDRDQLIELIEFSLANGLEPLVEVSNYTQMQMVNELSVSFIGINNRNILKYEIDNGDVGMTELLGQYKKPDIFLLSESGIMGKADVMRAISAGADGVLVGTAILQAEDPVIKYKQLAYPYNDIKEYAVLRQCSSTFRRT